MLQPFDLWGQRGWHGQEVVGEASYVDNIRKLLGRVTSQWSEVVVTAQLLPEPSNKHDHNAIQVKVDGSVVGYLPREDAASYVTVLARMVADGWLPQVSATVRGAMVSDYDYDLHGRLVGKERFQGSVRLDLAEPHLLTPANLPPSQAHVLLPRGAAIQVTGEETYLSTLAPLAGECGESWIHVTLHELVEQLARSTRKLVEVRVDGAPAGRLTPKMSGELLPAIRHFAEKGFVTAARAVVRGNRLKADIVLYVARSGELPAEWLECPQPAATATHRAGRQAETAWRFNPPPGWPEPPSGWTPPPDWTVPPDFPTPPKDWQWWLPITPGRASR